MYLRKIGGRRIGNRMINPMRLIASRSSCWAVEMMASKTPDDRRVALIFTLAGLGEIADLDLTGF